jgi:prolyl-tRNA editing enzyme YbaK/EbsC (Cys-tRNA(Pro) deacylase)
VDSHAAPNSRATLGSIERVRASLAERGLDHLTVREFAASTATASDAAAAIGTTVGRIVKSLVFMAADQPVLVLASSPNRVDVAKVSQLLGKPITRANADQVRALTGFAIGGVPPVGHAQRLTTLVDRDLLQYDQVWAAAGTPNAVFAIAPTDLVRIADGLVEDVT